MNERGNELSRYAERDEGQTAERRLPPPPQPMSAREDELSNNAAWGDTLSAAEQAELQALRDKRLSEAPRIGKTSIERPVHQTLEERRAEADELWDGMPDPE